MKFKYNNKTYVVFSTALEIINQDLIIKVEEDYLELSALVVNESYKSKDCIQSEQLLSLNTTKVLRHFSKNKKILQAYVIETKDNVIDIFYADSLEGKLSEAASTLIRLSDRYFNCGIKFTNHCGRAYYLIIESIEETEQQVLDRVRCKCDYKEAKYYVP